jgi:hypothetical protein
VCPSCGTSIVWLDGEPSPALHVQAEGERAVLRCARCLESSSRRRRPEPASSPTEDSAARARRIATETTLATAKGEIGHALDFLEEKGHALSEGLELASKVRSWWGKLRGA